jgi:hypothetical protein
VVAAGLTVTVEVAVTAGQGPVGSIVVHVRVIELGLLAAGVNVVDAAALLPKVPPLELDHCPAVLEVTLIGIEPLLHTV